MLVVEHGPVKLRLCFAWFAFTGDERNELTRVALDSRVESQFGISSLRILVCHVAVAVAV